MKKVTHILVTLTFTFACVSLWAMLTAVANLSPQLDSGSTGVHEALSELESIPPGLASSRRGLLRVRTDSQTQHSGVWDGLHRLDDDRTVSGFLPGSLCGLSSLFSVVGDEVRRV